MTLKSEDGFGEVSTVGVDVLPVVDVSDVVAFAGGVVGGVVGEDGPKVGAGSDGVVAGTAVSSISTGLCSWSRII